MTDKRNKPLHELLGDLNACVEAVEWSKPYGTDYERAWAECPRGDWMLWVAVRLFDVPQQTVVLAACECVRLALVHVPEGEDRPRLALEAAEDWARGGPTEVAGVDMAARAARAAYAAYAYAAYAADYAAYAAAAYAAAAAADAAAAAYAAYAAYAADAAAAYAAAAAAYAAAAAAAAAYAAEAARANVLQQCADIVRRHIHGVIGKR